MVSRGDVMEQLDVLWCVVPDVESSSPGMGQAMTRQDEFCGKGLPNGDVVYNVDDELSESQSSLVLWSFYCSVQ
ncbi:unnamed protein product [Bubo scandiacus]